MALGVFVLFGAGRLAINLANRRIGIHSLGSTNAVWFGD